MEANASGSVSGVPVAVELKSMVHGSNSSQRIGSIRVISGTGASLDALIASEVGQASADLGVNLPSAPNEGHSNPSSSDPSTAELVYDSVHGLRLLNISLASSAKIGMSGLARRLGIAWQPETDGESDPITFSAPWLYYVPSKPGAPNFTWAGKEVGSAELGVAATVDVPALGINATRGTLVVQAGGKLSLLISGSVTPVPALTLTSLAVNVEPGLMNASATGRVSGSLVAVQLASFPSADNSSVRVGFIRVTSSSGSSLDALLASQASAVSTDFSLEIPPEPDAPADNSNRTSAAEFVIDSQHGLRMLNISLASSSKVSLADLARRVGFVWDSEVDGAADPISFSAPWLYYVPSKPNATNITWAGRQLVGPELGVAATVDVPALGINATRGTLLVLPEGRLTLQVRNDRVG